jgi:hypothetical protein
MAIIILVVLVFPSLALTLAVIAQYVLRNNIYLQVSVFLALRFTNARVVVQKIL